MDKVIKIFLGVMISLGLLSAIFLMTAKKKTPTNANNKVVEKSAPVQQVQVPAKSETPAGQLPVLDQAQSQNQTQPQTQPQAQTSNKTELQGSNIATNQTATQTQPKAAPKSSPEELKAKMRSQWSNCKSGMVAIDTKMVWVVQITEGIPQGGTYAKGNLDSESYPVRVTVKSDSEIVDKIKGMLVPGKSAILRINYKEIAPDGSVVVQAY